MEFFPIHSVDASRRITRKAWYGNGRSACCAFEPPGTNPMQPPLSPAVLGGLLAVGANDQSGSARAAKRKALVPPQRVDGRADAHLSNTASRIPVGSRSPMLPPNKDRIRCATGGPSPKSPPDVLASETAKRSKSFGKRDSGIAFPLLYIPTVTESRPVP
jgi:hypothetical protein